MPSMRPHAHNLVSSGGGEVALATFTHLPHMGERIVMTKDELSDILNTLQEVLNDSPQAEQLEKCLRGSDHRATISWFIACVEQALDRIRAR